MRVTRAYQAERDRNDEQITACKRHAGAARWAYNGGLTRKPEASTATGKSPSAVDRQRELNALKPTDMPWMDDGSQCAPQEALRHRDHAFAHFLRRAALKQPGNWKGKLGDPQRQTRQQGLGSSRLTGASAVLADAVQVPRRGHLRLKEREYLPTSDGPMLAARVSERAGHGYVSLQVAPAQTAPANTGPVGGVDLGVKTLALATLSAGTVLPNPCHVKPRLKKLKGFQRAVSRQVNGSGNRKKAVRCFALQPRQVAKQRANTLQQLTAHLAQTQAVVGMEDLGVSGRLKHHQLAQAMANGGFSAFKRQLLDKASW